MEKKCVLKMTKPVLNSELVDTFWDLAESQDEKRISAGERLIGVIRRFQIEVGNQYM